VEPALQIALGEPPDMSAWALRRQHVLRLDIVKPQGSWIAVHEQDRNCLQGDIDGMPDVLVQQNQVFVTEIFRPHDTLIGQPVTARQSEHRHIIDRNDGQGTALKSERVICRRP
jgi:hypothetical protein